jgi:hypothetical protein
MSEDFLSLELKFQAIDAKIARLRANKWKDQEALLIKSVDRVLDFERIAEDFNDKRELLFDILNVRQSNLLKKVAESETVTHFDEIKPKLHYLRVQNLDKFDEDEFEILVRENKFFRVTHKRDFEAFKKLRYLVFYNPFGASKDDI